MRIVDVMSMKRIVKVCLLCFLYLAASICWAFVYSEPLHLSYILSHPDKFDKKYVTVRGEAIGEILNGNNGGVWLNISDAGCDIGLYARKREIFKNVKKFGGYGKRGDIIEARGIFYKDSPLSAERSIHTVSVKIVKRGYVLREAVPREEEFASFIFSIICLTLAAIYFIKLKYAGRH